MNDKISRREFIRKARDAGAALALVTVFPRLCRQEATATSNAEQPAAQEATEQIAKPNIIIITTDDQNKFSLPVMRHLKSYPGGGWTEFDTAVCPDPICGPSRGTMLTGQFSRNHGVTKNGYWRRLNAAKALPVWLKNAGYAFRALYGKYLYGDDPPTTKPEGWDEFTGRGGYADGVFADAIDAIGRAPEPFFIAISPVDPHKKANPPERYRTVNVDGFMPVVGPNVNEADVSDKPAWVRALPKLSTAKLGGLKAERQRAYRALLAVDDGVQNVVNALEERGILDKTVIIFWGDNGIHDQGQHRWTLKHTLYEPSIRVPLLIRVPWRTTNRVETRVVSTADIATTIADIAGATPLVPQDGVSLLPLINEELVDWTEVAFLNKFPDTNIAGTMEGVRTKDFTYGRWNNGDRELYDLRVDPYQLNNQAGNPDYADVVAVLDQMTDLYL